MPTALPDLMTRLRGLAVRARASAEATGRPVVAGLAWAASEAAQLARLGDGPEHPALRLLARAQRGDYGVFWRNSDQTLVYAGIGPAQILRTAGAQRFEDLGQRASAALAAAVLDMPEGAPRPRVWAGFTFFPTAHVGERWAGFAGNEGVLHRYSLTATPDGAWWMAFDSVDATTDVETWVAAVVRDLPRRAREDAGLAARPDASTVTEAVVRDRAFSDAGVQQLLRRARGSEERFARGVQRALALIQRGDARKIVLARSAAFALPPDFEVATALHQLCVRFDHCTVYAFGSPEELFVGATPERLLVHRAGELVTMALAGSMGRGRDADDDATRQQALASSAKDVREHAIVVETIRGALGSVGARDFVAEGPEVVTLPNIHHLRTRIAARVASPAQALQALAALHPTSAVCGEPRDRAAQVLAELEDMDRGWYASPVGWLDAQGDFAFVVALRCALICPPLALLFAGAGLVAGSEPSAELAETELKMNALRQVLGLQPWRDEADAGGSA